MTVGISRKRKRKQRRLTGRRATADERAGACMWRTVSTVGTQILRGRVFWGNWCTVVFVSIAGDFSARSRLGRVFGVVVYVAYRFYRRDADSARAGVFCNRVRLFSSLPRGISRRGARAGKCFGVMCVRLFPFLSRGISRWRAATGEYLGWSCTQVSLPFREIATSRVALLAMTRRYGCSLGVKTDKRY